MSGTPAPTAAAAPDVAAASTPFDVGAVADAVHRDGIAALRRAFDPGLGRAAAGGLRGPVRRGPGPARRHRGARPAPVLLRGPPGAGPRLRRPGHPPGRHRAVRAGPRPGLAGGRAGLRRAAAGRRRPALAPRLRAAGRATHDRRRAHLAGLQRDHGDRHPRDGPARGGAGHPVGRRVALRARHVPAGRVRGRLRGPGAAADAGARRRVRPHRADPAPGHRQPVRDRASGPDPRRGGAGGGHLGGARPHADPGLRAGAAAGGAGAPALHPSRRRAGGAAATTRHRGTPMGG